jgi:hypothetical protein
MACAPSTVPRVLEPPIIYFQEIPEPVLFGVTNGDLAKYVIDLREALRLANSDKRALQDWMTRNLKYD